MRLLLIDDNRDVRRAIRRMLARLTDVEVLEASSLDSALATIATEALDLLLVDLRLSPTDTERGGLELLRELRRLGRTTPSVIITSSSALDDLREAMRLGARDYVLKDELREEMLVPIIEGFRERVALNGEVQVLRERVEEAWGPSALLGSSSAMDRVRRTIARVADADATTLVRGETGTGKEMVARALHQASRRRNEPFVAVNCSAIPASLLESTLFGHERGAFTGADRRRRGRLEVAGAGTILLDEIADMSVELQSKLLRVVEEGRFLPVGAEREIPLRARVVAATNVDLESRIAEGRFRRDLFYRLNVVAIDLPNLAQRGDDLLELLVSFTEAQPRKLQFTAAAIEWLRRREWEGNVRELKNVVQRLSLLADDDTIDVPVLTDLVPPRSRAAELATDAVDRLVDAVLALPDGTGSRQVLVERALLRRALDHAQGNKSGAARILGIHRKALERRWERLSDETFDPEEDSSR